MRENKYYLCIPGHCQPFLLGHSKIDPIIFRAWSDCNYFVKVLEEVERNIGPSDLSFYLTWDTEELPDYGANVVVILLGDEHCKIPFYADKVLAVFKGYGIHLMIASNPFLNPSYYSFLCLLHYLRASLNRMPSILRHRFAGKSVNIFDIPIGCFNSIDQPMKDFDERAIDVSFIGGVGVEECSKKSIKYWLKTPKIIARRNLFENLIKVQDKIRSLKIYSSATPDTIDHISSLDSQERYIEILKDTKICLVPRGSSLETFRFFEAMKYGCILVTDVLPNRWFYTHAPILVVKDWCELENRLRILYENPSEMLRIHRDSLEWWNRYCSEKAVGKYISKQLRCLSVAENEKISA